jgi:hypothetical protein
VRHRHPGAVGTVSDLVCRSRLPAALTVALFGVAAIASQAVASRDVQLRSNGTLLRAPPVARTVTLSLDAGCRALLPAGTGDCGVVHATGGDLLFTVVSGPPVEDGLVARPWTVAIYRVSPSVPNGWQLALVTGPQGSDPGPVFANVTAKSADLAGDGHQSLVVGYRAEGTGEILDMDIVTGAAAGPRVAAHREFYKGVVQILPGHLVAYAPIYLARDGNCCPQFTQLEDIRYRNGQFWLSAGPRRPTRRVNIPPGDLG